MLLTLYDFGATLGAAIGVLVGEIARLIGPATSAGVLALRVASEIGSRAD